MWNRIRRWLALAAAVFTLSLVGSEEAGARGGGGGGGGQGGGGRGGGRGGGGRGGGRGSSTRGALRGAGRGAGRAGGGSRAGGAGNSAKDWEVLREQEERLAMVKARRERLMDLDRKKEQEAWLADKRAKAVDEQARPTDIR